ncbi:alpha/beta hydrolase [Streptomyces sp. A3M-1-3]|uniref:alpha/beta fold hydrolase n=1 Tax=Streptomyces sp. A3M-1-3 TaxID=2962044 RepID=UPI0020B8B40B|nr:alpha/beta hydrolase [Streptomyces sp. A3M-1-3]MCP3821585.1 alpha/beta hydrolase [Streptomyces sp. A3M-1-3]
MSKPPSLVLPDCARAYRLRTGRGDFAVHDARPDAKQPRGTALLVPGFTGSKEDFIGLLEPLAAAGFRTVAVDGRGQHESGGPHDELAYEQSELAQDVLAQAAALGDGPVHLLGHSLGGLIARAATLRAPARFASLTLMSSGPAAISESQQARTKLLVDALTVLDMEGVWRAIQEHDREDAADATTPPAVREFLHRRFVSNVPEQLIVTGRQLINEPDRVAELAAATPTMPKHVLSGAIDYAWPVHMMDDMAVRLDARRTVIDGTEHSPNAERPAATATALADFWTQFPQN